MAAMGRLREHPCGSAEYGQALEEMHAAMAEHARLAAARLLEAAEETGGQS